MKQRITLTLLLTATLVLSAAASASSLPRYQAGGAAISGGNYQLTNSGIQIGAVSAGGAYRLQGPSEPRLQIGGCCCTWIPCVLGNP